MIVHGTSAYANHHCRCDVCKDAQREASRTHGERRGVPAGFKSDAEFRSLMEHDHLGVDTEVIDTGCVHTSWGWEGR